MQDKIMHILSLNYMLEFAGYHPHLVLETTFHQYYIISLNIAIALVSPKRGYVSYCSIIKVHRHEVVL